MPGVFTPMRINFGRRLKASIDNSTEINFMQRIEELLTLTNLSNCYVKKLSQNINLFYEIKRQQQKKELLDVIDQLKSELTFKDRTIKKLHKAKHILQGQLLKINENYDKEKLHLENVLNKENLSNENVLLQKKQIEHSKFKNDESKDNLKLNNLPMPKEEDKVTCQLPHCSKDCTENMKLIEDLLNENTILKKENKIQKVMLQKLFLIYKNLLSKFENCQIKLSFLNSTINKDYTEELFNNLYGDHLLEVEVQKHTDYSEVSSDGVTEEILHRVRAKLQTLEDETKEIEDKYKNFR
ncbi:uncharacterized protein LOC108912805 isoform X2 [Anoplophora glabripennis]|uniref:uncharacterized protein LOC108912805 isoform X2 n=1 Tax=Anoplophora glabripennis TaxID=217634 RepID=UPI00087581DA|nr:uncharacterized protein LOC108912805 isoform X2 [Anoplophora glabripennis]